MLSCITLNGVYLSPILTYLILFLFNLCNLSLFLSTFYLLLCVLNDLLDRKSIATSQKCGVDIILIVVCLYVLQRQTVIIQQDLMQISSLRIDLYLWWLLVIVHVLRIHKFFRLDLNAWTTIIVIFISIVELIVFTFIRVLVTLYFVD